MSTDTLTWSDECQAKLLLAHEYAADNNTVGVLCAMTMLLVALQKAAPCKRDELIPLLTKRLWQTDSPIHLLARKSMVGNYRFPVLKDGVIVYDQVAHELHVHLEPLASYETLVREEWGTDGAHEKALAQSGFSYE